MHLKKKLRKATQAVRKLKSQKMKLKAMSERYTFQDSVGGGR